VYTAVRLCTFLLKTSFGLLTLLTTALLDFLRGVGDAIDMMHKESQIWTLPKESVMLIIIIIIIIIIMSLVAGLFFLVILLNQQ
jgi:hypothetical protein